MAVKLAGSCPRMQEAFALGRECGAVYAVLWEAAWHDDRGSFGGTTQMSHKALSEICGMSSKTVIKAVDLLMDDGLISCEGICLLYTSPSPRDYAASRMPSSA